MIPGLMSRLSEATMAAAATITVKTDLVKLTGNTAVATIKAPPSQGGFSTVIFIVPTTASGVATVTTGNIAVAVTMPQNRVTVLTYSKKDNVWYPGAIS